ncbi:MAG: alginate lyase family protein [Armatimonadetes bacterium]|nr:alginate lyase family protein [Armatimonadota bacterium]
MLHPALLGLLAAAAPLSPVFPPQHPYLALTAAEVARARDKADRLPWARRALDAVLDEAKGLAARPLGPVPAKGDTKHWGVAGDLFKVALGQAFSGDRAQAEWVRDGLLAYADAYPGWPLTNLRCKAFTQSSLYEAMWVVNLAQAYDLVADSGVLTAEQRRHVEDDLLRASAVCFKVDDYAADPRARDLHFRCYNFQAWHLSAVGLVGLATRDPALARYALDSPYGFPHLVAHDIRDDGMFWERSPGYHHFVISALLPLCEAMRHCGVDLYHLSVAPIRDRDEDCHYVTDSSDQPKSLAMMFTAPLYLAFPDTSYAALGDSDRGPLRGDWTDLIAWEQWHDPQLAWLLGRDVPLQAGQVGSGRVGFLHYYRYRYRYTDILLDGRPPVWARTDATYKLGDQDITVDDAGSSQNDHYLLTEATPSDFVLEWTLTRLVDSGDPDRAWVVWHVDPRDDANRRTFGVAGHCREIGRPYRSAARPTGTG